MITADDVKRFARAQGADLVGIAPMTRWEGAPKQMDPRYIAPNAKSMIVMGFRIARGSLRGVEEGTLYTTYPSMGYAALNQIYAPMTLWNLTNFLEDEGHETVAMLNANGGEAINPVTGNFRDGWSVPVGDEKPHPDVLVHFRLAAFLAGLGEIGYSKVFLTPQFGPRQRFALCLTDAELEPDPIFEGKICDRCMLCAKHCPTGAISTTETVKVTVAGHELEWAKLNPLACEAGIQGGHDNELNPFLKEYPRRYGYGRAIGGASRKRASSRTNSAAPSARNAHGSWITRSPAPLRMMSGRTTSRPAGSKTPMPTLLTTSATITGPTRTPRPQTH